MYAPTAGASCTACPAGKSTLSSTGQTQCFDCPAGTFSTAGGPCQPCPAGTFSTAGSPSCTPCPAGSDSAEGSSACTCKAGYSRSGSGANLVCTSTLHTPQPQQEEEEEEQHGRFPRWLTIATLAGRADRIAECLAGTYAAVGATTCSCAAHRESECPA